MDYLGALEAFVHASELRSFTQAGQRLGTSSSAVSKAVARLEDELGVSLLHRSTRAVTLTGEGAMFLERCHRILAELDVARKELTEAAGKPMGRLKVGLPQIGSYFMTALMAFQKAYPDIELELDFTDRLVNVIDEGFDAVIRVGEVQDSRLSQRRLGGYRHHLVASPEYLGQATEPASSADLAGHHCLRYRYPTSGKIAPWPLGHAEASPDLPHSSTSNTIEALADMARAGLGIALVPEFVVSRDIAAGILRFVLKDLVQEERSIYILWPSSRQQLPKIAAFTDFMMNSLKSSDGQLHLAIRR